MSQILLDAAIAEIRAKFDKKDVVAVEPYGGQFNADESTRTSYACPAIFVSVLGWKPGNGESQLLTGRGVRLVRMAAFVVAETKRSRADRLALAMNLADRLALTLTMWRPTCTDVMDIAGLEADPRADNLYSAALDKKGQALFLVDWWQAVKPRQPLDGLYQSLRQQTDDLVRVEITDAVHQGNAAAAPAPEPADLLVTEDVTFKPLEQ
ncbi:MAG: hypothetical protein QM617_09170 [Comamonas sp.]